MPKPAPLPDGTPSITVPLDGMVEIPNGTIATIVTFLEMRQRPHLPPPADGAPTFEPLARDEVARFRRLFAAVGEEWLWTSRLRHSDATVAARLAQPGIETLAIRRDGADIGLVELDHSGPGAAEIVLFGLVPEAVGHGAGKAAMTALLARLWAAPGMSAVWLHTCTLDHPRALGFYQSFGFKATGRAIEIGPDPRLSGLMPRGAAPSHPVIE